MFYQLHATKASRWNLFGTTISPLSWYVTCRTRVRITCRAGQRILSKLRTFTVQVTPYLVAHVVEVEV